MTHGCNVSLTRIQTKYVNMRNLIIQISLYVTFLSVYGWQNRNGLYFLTFFRLVHVFSAALSSLSLWLE